MLGHGAFAVVGITQDLDPGAGGHGEETEELARARRQHHQLLGVQERGVASERRVGGEGDGTPGR